MQWICSLFRDVILEAIFIRMPYNLNLRWFVQIAHANPHFLGNIVELAPSDEQFENDFWSVKSICFSYGWKSIASGVGIEAEWMKLIFENWQEDIIFILLSRFEDLLDFHPSMVSPRNHQLRALEAVQWLLLHSDYSNASFAESQTMCFKMVRIRFLLG